MNLSTKIPRYRAIAIAILLPVAGLAADSFTYPDLVQRLYDFKHLAEPPAPGERSGSWASSQNSTARYDAETDTYLKWGDGNDATGFLRQEGETGVVADIEGSGVIWRVWSADPRLGHVKFFIDGAKIPVLDMPFRDYFDNGKEPFNFRELAHVLSRGHNSYVPIPFNKSIKIVLENDWGLFYHFTYTLFPKGTSVPSFKGFFDPAEKAALVEANKVLGQRGTPKSERDAGTVLTRDILIPPGKTVQLADLRGARAITSFRVAPLGLEDPSKRQEAVQALRELAFQISWDNERAPSVWSPLGDFFGTAPGINQYRSLPVGMTSGEFYANWYMPFAERALLELQNDGSESRRVRISITHQSEPRADRLLRFHAKWHRDDFAGRNPDRYLTGDRWPDWPVLITGEGQGRFCGFHLHVWNPNPLGNRRGTIPGGFGKLSEEQATLLQAYINGRAWWGEGDEKFFVDGEKFPSTFGTGSEDYFGYAYAAFHPDTFDSAFQSQPLNNNNYGHVSNVRFQIADNVPFQRSFEAVIEKYHPNEWPLLYATTAYWYQAAGAVDKYGPVSRDQRMDYFVEVPRSTDVYEAEELEVSRRDSGEVVFDAWSMQYSADHAIVWRNVAKAGERLVLSVPIDDPGEYEIFLRVGRSVNAGTYQVTMNGKVVASELDLGRPGIPAEDEVIGDKLFFQYSQYATQVEEIELGRHILTQGPNELGFEAIKAGTDGSWALPIDALRLRKVKQ